MKHLLPSLLSLVLLAGCECIPHPSTDPYEGYTGNRTNRIIINAGDSACQSNTAVRAFIDGVAVYKSHRLPLTIDVDNLEHRVDIWTMQLRQETSMALEFSGMVQINRDTVITLICP